MSFIYFMFEIQTLTLDIWYCVTKHSMPIMATQICNRYATTLLAYSLTPPTHPDVSTN